MENKKDDENNLKRSGPNWKENLQELDTDFEESEQKEIDDYDFWDLQCISDPPRKFCLSTNSKVFRKSASTNKNDGFKIDSKGLLNISGFDESLNTKFTNQLAEFFKKTSKRFKVSPKMDTISYIKTLYNMYLQHYSKNFKQTGEFNDEASSKLFPQIIKFMHHNKLIQGKLLTQIVENNLFSIREIEENSKLTVDCEGLLRIFNEYELKPEMEGTTVYDKKIILPTKDKVEITIKLTRMLLSNLSKSLTGLPKNKGAMLKKIGSIIRMYATSNEINSDYKQTLDRNKQVRFWILDLLQVKNIATWNCKGDEFMINKDKMHQYLSDIDTMLEEWKLEVSQVRVVNTVL